MSDAKTKPGAVSVSAYVDTIPDPEKRKDAKALVALFKKVSGEKPVLWGTRIIGFGTYHYRYASGREGDAPRLGFGVSKDRHVIYITDGAKTYGSLLKKLGKHATGSSCLYIKKLSDVDLAVLTEIAESSMAYMDRTYPRR